MENKIKKQKTFLILGVVFLALFCLFIILVKAVDVGNYTVRELGQKISSSLSIQIGFSTMNKAFASAVGNNLAMYKITEYLGYLSFVPVAAFAVIGIVEWVKRKSLLKVDYHILVLGAFYLFVLAVYVAFLFVKVNARPVLINGKSEASFPSSHVMLAITTMVSFMLEMPYFVHKKWLKVTLDVAAVAYLLFMIIGRVISGVHWLSDYMGAVIISVSLLSFFVWGLYRFNEKKD